MSRQEDFIDAGIDYRMKHSKPMCIAGSDLADVERDFNRVISFEFGAEHGYQYAIKKTIEFLKEKEFGDWIEQEATSFIEDFRRAMEEWP